jgi:ribonucleotide reductase beta subunit family protein with ferritin-like domain
LTSDEKHYLTHVLAFFAASDGIVNENVIENMMSAIKIPEARCFYGFQIAIENIHAETYSLLIDTFVTDEEKKHELLNAINTIPSIQKKAEWCLRWIESEDATFEQRLVAFAIVEGVFFSSSFCSLYWMKKRNLLPGLCFSNELISRDEYLHVEFACLLFRTLAIKNLSQEEFEEMIRDAVDCEIFFVQEGLPVSLIGMNCDLMCQYVWYVADRLAERLGFKPVFGQKTHQFDWMNLFRMDVKSNTHENQNSQYQKVVDVNRMFTTDEDF